MIPLFKVNLISKVLEHLKPIIDSGYIGEGSIVKQFEAKLSKYIGPNAITVNSGTSAIHLALRLCGVKNGTNVISTPMTCAATNMPILANGGKVIWCDINPRTGNIDPYKIRKLINRKTKAIICVHWAGYPCDLSELRRIEYQTDIPVIQDAAHAFGAKYKNNLISHWTRFTCFSFQAIKHLTTIDGGALVCRDNDDAKKAKLLRWYGMDREQSSCMRCEADVKHYGYKFHMNDVNAMIGLQGLRNVSLILAQHRLNADEFMKELCDLKRVKLLEQNKDIQSSNWIFTILVDCPSEFETYMRRNGIAASRVHIRNDIYSIFKCSKRRLKVLDEFAKHYISIPVGWWLSKEDRELIIETIKQYDKEK